MLIAMASIKWQAATTAQNEWQNKPGAKQYWQNISLKLTAKHIYFNTIPFFSSKNSRDVCVIFVISGHWMHCRVFGFFFFFFSNNDPCSCVLFYGIRCNPKIIKTSFNTLNTHSILLFRISFVRCVDGVWRCLLHNIALHQIRCECNIALHIQVAAINSIIE